MPVNWIWICSQIELKILDRKNVQFLYAHGSGFGGFSGTLVTGCALESVYHLNHILKNVQLTNDRLH